MPGGMSALGAGVGEGGIKNDFQVSLLGGWRYYLLRRKVEEQKMRRPDGELSVRGLRPSEWRCQVGSCARAQKRGLEIEI